MVGSTSTVTGDPQDLLSRAKGGSFASLGQLLNLYSNYLKLLIASQLDARLRSRVSPSDIVQDTFFEAHRDFHQFRGHSTGEFVSWIRRILVNNLLRSVEHHVLTEKRDIRREVSLERLGVRLEQSTMRLEKLLVGSVASPSSDAERREHELILADAVADLPGDYRDVIVLRHIEGLPFREVAERMQRSPGAVRMLWLRAIRQLRGVFMAKEILE